MKRRGNYLLLLLLIITSGILTVIGLAGKDGIYAGYGYRPEKEVLLSLPMKGLKDNINPVFALVAPYPQTDDIPAEAQSGEVSAETKPEDVHGEISEDAHGEITEDAHAKITEDTHGEITEDAHTEITADSPSDTANTGAGDAAPETTVTVDNDPVIQHSPEARPVPEDHLPEADAFPLPYAQNPPPVSGAPAEDSYYADALFIGDSRTVGLSQYVPGLDAYATFYCAVSLSVFNAMSAPIAGVDGDLISVEEALQKRSFGKIYIMVGINEIGYDRSAWLESYRDVVSRIRELQPFATIYIQSIMHVSSEKAAAQPVFNNPEINARNEGLMSIANGTDIIYMDINYLLDDANGALNSDLSFDGVHLTAGAYDLWYQEIKAQTR